MIDDEWIEIFEKYNISVSISIDGPKHINDRYRLDHKGRSSYEATMNGYQALYSAAENRKIIPTPPILSVINPDASGKELFEYFYHDMKCRKFDFLLPDNNYVNTVDTEGIKRFLVDICDAWFAQNDPECDIRILSAYLRILTGAEDYIVLGVTPQNELHQTIAITVTSTGYIYVDDTLRSTLSDIFVPICHIRDASYQKIITSFPMRELSKIESFLPDDCHGCIWKAVCAGGRPINRYSQDNAFKNKTIYCDAMQSFLSRGAAYLINLGINSNEIAKNIGVDKNA
ncbi:XyeB family radical SAM/SPASM peptide maturase [Providencia rettgeri]